jgi:hypothetical protein
MSTSSRKAALALVFLPALIATAAHAAVSAADAEKLKSTLTPLGAEKAGNAAGTIPAWDGGWKGSRPAGLKAGEVGKDPFPDDKPVLKITAKDLDKYNANLSETTKTLLKTYPDFYVNVYPTRRTGVAPQWVYDNTFKNATTAELSDGNLKVSNAYGGTPFPIPKTGGEIIWNHFLSWKGGAVSTYYNMHLITADGRRSLASEIDIVEQYPYYIQNGKDKFDGNWWLHKGTTTAPARSNGEALIGRWPLDLAAKEPGSWQYMPGQRRVRKLPNVNYDTPNFYMSGVTQFDEAYGFFGKPDQYDWKIVGKQEMYAPYNSNKINGMPVDDLVDKHTLKPEHQRWELHRVWVVEGTLLPGKRNVVPKRRVYVDEDTWNILLSDQWDAQGKLWRGMIGYPMVAYDVPAVIPLPFATWDFQQRAWSLAGFVQKYAPITPKPDNFFNPDTMAQDALR